jgi:hypothetical protein
MYTVENSCYRPPGRTVRREKFEMAGEYGERNRWREVGPILAVAGLVLAAMAVAAIWAALN